MNVKEIGGKLLVICRAGCSVQEILEATGQPWSVLFEEREHAYHRAVKSAFPAADVLRALETEALIVALAASNMANLQPITDEDRSRIMTAYQRIYSAVRMSIGEH